MGQEMVRALTKALAVGLGEDEEQELSKPGIS